MPTPSAWARRVRPASRSRSRRASQQVRRRRRREVRGRSRRRTGGRPRPAQTCRQREGCKDTSSGQHRFSLSESSAHENAGLHSPPLPVGLKYLGCHVSPLLSRSRAASRCASSISVLASVAASRFFALIAAVTLAHSRRDSFGACWSSGETDFCTTSAFLASNKTSLPLPCRRTVRLETRPKDEETRNSRSCAATP